jgi:hypothetical protein
MGEHTEEVVRQVEFTAVASCVSHRDTRNAFLQSTAGGRPTEDGRRTRAPIQRLSIVGVQRTTRQRPAMCARFA